MCRRSEASERSRPTPQSLSSNIEAFFNYMHFIYIIYTAKFDKYYIGETVNISDRIEEHKTGYFKDSSTKYTDDWVLVLSLQTDSRTSAREIERYIKSMKSKKFIKRLISETAYLDVFKQIVKDKFQIELL